MTTTASVAKTRRSLRRLYMRIYSCCMQRQSICNIPPNIRILLKLESASCELCCTDENAYLYRYTELSVGTTRFILSLVGLTRKWKTKTFSDCRCHIIDCTWVYILVVCRDKAYAAFHQKIRDFAQIRVGCLLALFYRSKNAYLHRYTELSVGITRFILPLVCLTRKWKTRTFVAYALCLQTTSLNKNIYACTDNDMTTTASVAKTRRSLHRLYMRIYSCCL